MLLNKGDETGFQYDDEAIIVRREKITVVKNNIDETEVSEHVKFRLFLARTLAIKKYQEKWA